MCQPTCLDLPRLVDQDFEVSAHLPSPLSNPRVNPKQKLHENFVWGPRAGIMLPLMDVNGFLKGVNGF